MGLPMLKYNTGSGPDVEIHFKRGPQGFTCDYAGTVHDNVATSGVMERVFERADMIISFGMPAMLAGDDLAAWGAFMAWALQGGWFAFSPNEDLSDYYHCKLDMTDWRPVRVGLKRYSAGFRFRIVPDEQMPASPAVVLERYAGVAA